MKNERWRRFPETFYTSASELFKTTQTHSQHENVDLAYSKNYMGTIELLIIFYETMKGDVS